MNFKTMLCCAGACLSLVAGLDVLVGQTTAPKPKRINRAIELLEQGQPIYYTGSHSGTTGTFEQGKKDASTYADYISYDMEAAPYDIEPMPSMVDSINPSGADDVWGRWWWLRYEGMWGTTLPGAAAFIAGPPLQSQRWAEPFRWVSEQGVSDDPGERGSWNALFEAASAHRVVNSPFPKSP